MSLIPPPPPPRRHKFEGSSGRVFVTRQKEVPVELNPNKNYTQGLTITGFYTANGKDIYATSSGPRDATIVDAYYAISPLSGGKRKTCRSRRRKCKSKSRKNHNKTSRRRKKTSYRR